MSDKNNLMSQETEYSESHGIKEQDFVEDKASEELEISPYSRIALLFIELRNRGSSLSQTDLEVLKSWSDQSIPLDFIEENILALAEECDKKKKEFPRHLLSVSRRIKKSLISFRST